MSKCGEANVFEGPDAFMVCEKSQTAKRPCKVKLSKVILQQPIDRAQAAKLLADNKSDLLRQIISSPAALFRPIW